MVIVHETFTKSLLDPSAVTDVMERWRLLYAQGVRKDAPEQMLEW